MQGPFLRWHCYHFAALHTVGHTFLKYRASSSGSDVPGAISKSSSICKGPLPLASLTLASLSFLAMFLTAKIFWIPLSDLPGPSVFSPRCFSDSFLIFFLVFYRYFICGYHGLYIKLLMVITIYFKLITSMADKRFIHLLPFPPP